MGSRPSTQKPPAPLEDLHHVPIVRERERPSTETSTHKPSTPSQHLPNVPIITNTMGGSNLPHDQQHHKLTNNIENKVSIDHQPAKPILEELKRAPSNKEKKTTTANNTSLEDDPPYNFKPIMEETNLFSGVFLDEKRKKYWVDEKCRCNCFLLFARDLKIVWGDDTRYWRWSYCRESSYPDIQVAELLNVCWLELTGKIKMSNLSPGIVYKFAFVVMLKERAYGWETAPVTLKLQTPDGKVQESKVTLYDKARGQWLELQVGTFSVEDKSDGEIQFSLLECEGGAWKSGLVVQGVVIKPL